MNTLKRFLNYFRYAYYFIGMSKMNAALSRAAVTSSLRTLDYTDPISWEFSGFSQSGQDGILDVLTRKLSQPNRYFIEIGSNNGLENNTAWLALARRYSGMMIEGEPRLAARCEHLLSSLCIGLDSVCMFVGRDNITEIQKRTLFMDPDVFSLDIDGNDYHVAKKFLKAGFRPKIIVVEYNSSFGPHKSVAIPYRENIEDIYKERRTGELPMAYWGCSVSGWINLFNKYGYKFLTVDSNGVDAFFIHSEAFDSKFVNNLNSGLKFQENTSSRWHFRCDWEGQFKEMAHLPLIEIN